MNNPPPNPDEYHEGKAIYVNEPGFYSIVLGSKLSGGALGAVEELQDLKFSVSVFRKH